MHNSKQFDREDWIWN